MYKENDYVVYKRDVCKVKEIKFNQVNNKYYYILVPIDDNSLIIKVPINNNISYLRSVISNDKANQLIENIPNIKPLDNIDDKYIERVYKDLIYNGNHEDLIKIIKTTYLRNNIRLNNNKKISDKDNTYFRLAEKYLYNELSIALDMDFNNTKNFIIIKVNELINK
ncbi:MAG: CarD family transcriptional regulator [Bacilli bacterium]